MTLKEAKALTKRIMGKDMRIVDIDIDQNEHLGTIIYAVGCWNHILWRYNIYVDEDKFHFGIVSSSLNDEDWNKSYKITPLMKGE